VAFADNGERLVGQAAKRQAVTNPMNTIYAVKRLIGRRYDDPLTVKDRGLVPYKIVDGDNGDAWVEAKGKKYPPSQISAFILGKMKETAEVFLGESVTQAVITVPAYFNDLQRKATQNAGKLAGFEVRRLLTEPTAAALAYSIGLGADEHYVMVVDLGGGTFDVSLLHCFEGVMEVRATAGDTFLGGENFDDVIIAAFMEEAGSAAGIPPIGQWAPVHGALRRQAELAKRRLSDADVAELALVYQDRPLTWSMSREKFEHLSEPVLARVRLPIERALHDAKIDPATLSQVILAGGATRMPMMRRMIGRLFRRMPMSHINPDEVVARGAAVSAGLIARSAGLEEVVMTDVAPFTLGISVSHKGEDGVRTSGLFMPIIERNTVIPASRVKVVTTIEDNQTSLNLEVFQGEAPLVKDNIKLGTMKLRLPPAREGEVGVGVRFTYDPSGLLEVEATVDKTGVTQRVVIEGNPGALSPQEVAERLEKLSALKLNPRDDAGNAALLSRAQRLFEQRLGRTRVLIGAALAEFLSAIDGQAPAQIRVAAEHLRKVLDSHDDESSF